MQFDIGDDLGTSRASEVVPLSTRPLARCGHGCRQDTLCGVLRVLRVLRVLCLLAVRRAVARWRLRPRSTLRFSRKLLKFFRGTTSATYSRPEVVTQEERRWVRAETRAVDATGSIRGIREICVRQWQFRRSREDRRPQMPRSAPKGPAIRTEPAPPVYRPEQLGRPYARDEVGARAYRVPNS